MVGPRCPRRQKSREEMPERPPPSQIAERREMLHTCQKALDLADETDTSGDEQHGFLVKRRPSDTRKICRKSPRKPRRQKTNEEEEGAKL